MGAAVTVADLAGWLKIYTAKVAAAPDDPRAQAEHAAEIERMDQIVRRRLYYWGIQYESGNEARRAELGLTDRQLPLPEHERLHAYSADVADATDFIADALTEKFSAAAVTSATQALIDAMLAGSPPLAPTGICETIRDALVGGDVWVHIGWDPLAETPTLEAWEGEHVTVEARGPDLIDKVTRSALKWTSAGPDLIEVVEHAVYDVTVGPAGGPEAREQIFHDGDFAKVIATRWLGLPFVPWWPLRCAPGRLRQVRGQSMISEQALGHVRRYDAVMTEGWLSARHNAHATLGVVGDAAALQAEQGRKLEKDVADVLTFPGGTSLQSLQLPTDVAPLQMQLDALSDAVFAAFGLVPRQGLPSDTAGRVSGYALEILNRKSEGTLRRVRANLQHDIAALLDRALDVAAYRLGSQPVLDAGAVAGWDGWTSVDPLQTIPDRTIDVRLGTGWIVDEVSDRDDYTAGVLSRAEVLRRRGYTDVEIAGIEREIEAETAASQPELPQLTAARGVAALSATNTAQPGT